MADHSLMSQVEVLSVTDTGRRRRWTDAEKFRIVEESHAAPRRAAATARRYEISRSLLTRLVTSTTTEATVLARLIQIVERS